MARPLRIEYEGAFYHVTSRGNEGRRVFFSKSDYEKFLDYLKLAQEKFRYLLHAYVLMTKHYHLLIETPLANLNRIMHYINGSYTNYVNLKRDHRGHLFQGRYKAILVDRDHYLAELSRYMHLNPVRAGIVKRPQDYPYSSYRAFISKGEAGIVYRDLILGMMGKDQRRAIMLYKDFVESAIGSKVENPLKDIYGGAILGSRDFIRDTLEKLEGEGIQKRGISHGKDFKKKWEVQKIIDKVDFFFSASPNERVEKKNKETRDVMIYLMKSYTGLTNRQIGEQLGSLSDFTVAKVYQRFLEKLRTDELLAKRVEEIASKPR
jgi:putative transposase